MHWQAHEHGIVTIDTGYQRAGLVASHLMQQGDSFALIDVGTDSCVQRIRDCLEHYLAEPGQLEYIMVTHVHLDHAGAAGTLMREYPQARLVVHPRGARHMIDPSRLIAGATAVYGEAGFREMMGEVIPVDANRVMEAQDDMTLDFNGRTLRFIDTPGHARHHYCLFDERSRSFFTGDTFGLSYRDFDVNGRAFVFPTTTPVQFDPEALHQSIDRMMAYDPQAMFMTHFGKVDGPQSLAPLLHRQIDAFVDLARSVAGQDNRYAQLLRGLQNICRQSLSDFGYPLEQSDWLALMLMDLELNAQGLECWLEQQQDKPA